MNGLPVVTAIVPTHDRKELLVRTLKRVVAQRDVALDLVVVDDASTTDVERTLGELRAPELRLLRHERSRGVAAARNTGWKAARGQWVAFCDDDDLWAPDKLARQVAAAERSDRRWVYCGCVEIDAADRVIGGGPPLDPSKVVSAVRCFNAVPGGGSGALLAADLLEQSGGFDERLRYLEDWELWMRLVRVARPAVVEAPLVGYRLHQGNIHLRAAPMLDALDQVEQWHGPTDRAAFLRRLAWAAWRTGNQGTAVRLFAAAANLGDHGRLVRELAGALRNRVLGSSPGARRHASWLAEAQRWICEPCD